MPKAHLTRVFGGLKDHRLWLRACVQAGFVPDIIFTVGRRYVVATSSEGALFIRRGPCGPMDITRDSAMFSQKLRSKASATLMRHMTDMSKVAQRVKWTPSKLVAGAEKLPDNVS